jgi:4-amino-4-deoxy-L-arabinose transferase-like glycosyltransferase
VKPTPEHRPRRWWFGLASLIALGLAVLLRRRGDRSWPPAPLVSPTPASHPRGVDRAQPTPLQVGRDPVRASAETGPGPAAPLSWLRLPNAEAMGFRGLDAYALPGVGMLAVPADVLAPRRRTRPLADIGLRARWRAAAAALVGDLPWTSMVLALFSAALALRLIHHSSDYGVFIDEITYSNIVQSVALGHGVLLYGGPFFLHPPLVFYVDAILLKVFGNPEAARIALVFQLRLINCAVGAVDVALMMLFVRRCVNRPAAVLVGAFMAIDPFILLWDGRVLLETLAMTTAMAGWLCLEWMARHQRSPASGNSAGPRDHDWVTGLGGMMFGLSLLCKETYAFVGVVPLAGMCLLNSPVRRRVTGGMLITALGCYVAYVLSVLADGRISIFFNDQFGGLLRAIGLKQITGFNQKGHHASLGAGIAQDLSLYLVSYLMIGFVGIAALVGALRWFRSARAGLTMGPQRRLAIALGVGSVGYVVYAMIFGAFETQIFYMGILGGLPALATEVAATRPRIRSGPTRRRVALILGTALVCAFAFELSVDVRQRVEKDTALAQLVNYVQGHIHYPSVVDSTDQVSAFVLPHVGLVSTSTVAGVERRQPDYIVVEPKLAAGGYASFGDGFRAWLTRHARVVWQATGSSTGPIRLYRTEYATEQSAPGLTGQG